MRVWMCTQIPANHNRFPSYLLQMLFPKELQKPVDRMLGLLTKMKYYRHQVESDVDPLLQAIHSLKKLRQSRRMSLNKVCVVCVCLGGKTPLHQFS